MNFNTSYIHIKTISMKLSILYCWSNYILSDAFLSQKIMFIWANSADDPDEMPHFAAFHLDLHCLPKYLFMGIKNEKG